MQGSTNDRRMHDAQREAVERLMPDPGQGSVLRISSGEILIYDEHDEKRRPVNLRAVVLPDGSTREFETGRFRRR